MTDATGALEELLLLHRSLVDGTLHSLEEDAPLGDLVALFRTTVLSLQRQEPSFWQLQIVAFIRNVLQPTVGACVHNAAASETQQDPVQLVARTKRQVETRGELQEALKLLQSDVEREEQRLTLLLHAETNNQRATGGEEAPQIVDKFWDKLRSVVHEKQQKADEERGVETVEEEFESCSFEMLTFDDDMSRSAMSFPCMEEFPATIMKMQTIDATERAAGLDEIMQMPIVEIIHSGPAFPVACSALVGLFLDIGVHGENSDTAERAKRVVYDLMTQIEDAAQYLELYWSVLDFVGFHLETGELFLDRQRIGASNDAHTIAVLDCFRVLHALLSRVLQHWVYFSPEALAQLLHCTLRIFTMYSSLETDVEAKHVNPFVMLSLIDDHAMQWLKLWLLNVPNRHQLFVAIDESGFVADLLQYLSRIRPLALIKSTQSTIDGIEKRTVQSTLNVLSYICEYQEGRSLVCRWQRVSAHAYIKQRRSTWKRPTLESYAAENDSVYRVVQKSAPEEERTDELEADYEHLGAGAVDALILSIAAMVIATPLIPLDGKSGTYCEQWTNSIFKSISAYLHASHLDEIIAGLVQIVDNCWMDPVEIRCASTELEEKNPWFPFRQSKSVAEVCKLVMDSVSKMISSGVLTKDMVRSSAQFILYAIMLSESMLQSEARAPNKETTKSLMRLCKRLLQSWHVEGLSSCREPLHWSLQSKLFDLIRRATSCPWVFKVANEFGVVDELAQLWNLYSARIDHHELPHMNDRTVAVLCHSTDGVRYVNNKMHFVSHCLGGMDKRWNELSTVNFDDIVGYMATPVFSRALLSMDEVQTTVIQAAAQFQESVDFAVALNSPFDECPTELRGLMFRVQLLQCCLSTQFAASSILSLEHSPLLQFVADTLATHKRGACTSSCHAEDTCCLAFQLALSLVSSVPAVLECSSLFSELKLLDLDGKHNPQRDVLPDGIEHLGSCSLLEKQLCYELEFVGGPSEKRSRCELYDFDTCSHHTNITHEKNAGLSATNSDDISDFAFTLQKKILQAIKDGAATDLSVPMDFVLISQASWELINDLEANVTASSSSITCKSASAFTKIFAGPMHDLVMSRRSRLEPCNWDEQVANSTTQSGEKFFPSDSQRKLMNRLYKNYASGLSLDASPTLLHCIVKKFGKAAMDSFPVTVLLLLHPTYDEDSILRFLSHCSTSASSRLLWPKCVFQSDDGANGNIVVSPAMAIASGVEIILEREFPQLLQLIDQCHCSLLSLVLRWHGQNFWNYFDWKNVVIYTYFSVLYGAEFQVYLIVAILKHLEPTMRELIVQHSSQSLAPFLMLIREPVRGFRFSRWRKLLLRLRSEYHEEVEAHLFTSD